MEQDETHRANENLHANGKVAANGKARTSGPLRFRKHQPARRLSEFHTRFTSQPLPEREQVTGDHRRFLCQSALTVRELSIKHFPGRAPIELVGHDQTILDLMQRISKVARFDEPILITGESGVGKELVARAIYLLSGRAKGEFAAVNCPQHQDGNLTVSELFGHERGSFTGAAAERKGCFEAADGGVVFLDEVADLPMSAQVMLLRALAEGEFKRLGSNKARQVNVRVVAATNRPLSAMKVGESFREDLFFRLRYFALDIAPLRKRGNDWYLLLLHRLKALQDKHGVERRFSDAALRLLESYPWPGNIRELNNIVATGYAMADDIEIEPRDIEDMLGRTRQTSDDVAETLMAELSQGRQNFWTLVHEPFLNRDLNRREVRSIVRRGLAMSNNSYREVLGHLGVDDSDYQRFMDFLRHHDLKAPN